MNTSIDADSETTSDEADLPLFTWRMLVQHFAAALDTLRDKEPVRSLDSREWTVFTLYVLSLASRESSTERELGARAGLCARTVRRCLSDLERLELVRVRAAEIRVGSILRRILVRFAEVRDPAIWRWDRGAATASGKTTVVGEPPSDMTTVVRGPARVTAVVGGPPSDMTTVVREAARVTAVVSDASGAGRPSAQATTGAPTRLEALIPAKLVELRAVAPSDPVRRPSAVPVSKPVAPTRAVTPSESPLLINKKKDLSSSCSEGGTPAPATTVVTGPAPATTVVTGGATRLDALTSRRVAVAALAALHRRAFPEVPAPRTWDAHDVHLVEACTADEGWDAATLEQMHLDAVDGAFDRSTSQSPTPRFIWGQLRHFLAHVQVGRAKRAKRDGLTRLAAKNPPPAPEGPPAPDEWVVDHMRQAISALDRIPDHPRPKPALRFQEPR